MKDATVYTMRDGTSIPVLGFGTYALNGREGATSIRLALEGGYRLLDSAFNYENEGAVGEAIRTSGIPREEVFVTSKLPGRHHAYKEALYTVEESLFRAGLSYFDLYLIHWPNPKEDRYVEAWQAMIEAQKRGYVKSIGVCNFLPDHIRKLRKETAVIPAVNQIELHPYFNQLEQVAWHKRKGIVTEAWSPLGRGIALFKEPLLVKLAEKYGKSISQLILRWHVQHEIVPIPKAFSQEHQQENLHIFDFVIEEEDMKKIDMLTKPNGRIKNQDPAIYQEF